MNPLNKLVSGLFGSIATAAGTSVAAAAAKNPTVQDALTDIEARLDRAQTIATVTAVVASVVVAFYYLPRFESPIPRIFRR